MPEKIRLSVSLNPKTNAAIKRLARVNKPDLSKSYIVDFALLRLLDVIDAKQLTLDAAADASL